MREWFEAGYIYKDFASRTNDPFYLPNTALTYSGGAGIWLGFPDVTEDGLVTDTLKDIYVEAIPNPIDTASGITSAPNTLYANRVEGQPRVAISTSCENIERLLSTLDFLYTEEGGLLKANGLDAEQGSADNEIYKKNGLADGAYTLTEDGTLTLNKRFATEGGNITDFTAFGGERLPGFHQNAYSKATEQQLKAHAMWTKYQDQSNKLPTFISRTTEESDTYTNNQTNINDFMNAQILKFILGTEELNQTTWSEFKDQLVSYDIEDNIAIQQAAYERYLAR
jgi:hypothetical protein